MSEMSFRKLNYLCLILASALAVISCKDDDETTVTPSLDGSLSFLVPEYVLPEAVVTMVPSGVAHPDGEELGYCWKVSPTMTKADTTRYENGLDKNGKPSDGSFTHTFSDTLKTYTVTGYAFAKGYSTSTSKSHYVTVVKGGLDGSIKNIALTGMPSVEVNGATFPYVTIGSTDWMCRNMSAPAAGAPYMNNRAMDDVFGRYYSYEEALEICPEGWQLPSEKDWIELAVAAGAEDITEYETIKGIAAAIMGNTYFNDDLMWEYWPSVGEITNSTGISMMPVGYATLGNKNTSPKENEFIDNTYPQAMFKGYKQYAAFWTADTAKDEEGMAYYRYLISEQPDLFIEKGDINSFGASVRCIRK